MASFSPASLFPAGKLEAVTHGETREIEHPMRRRTQGDGIVKTWDNKRDYGSIPGTFTECKNYVSVGLLTLPTIEPQTPPTPYRLHYNVNPATAGSARNNSERRKDK